LFVAVASLCFSAALPAQLRVDPRYSLHRVIAIVPLFGSGTPADPKRGKYVPTPQTEGAPGTGIIAFALELTDDGTHAIVELVAVERATLVPILADHGIQAFEKGVASNSAIESAIRPSLTPPTSPGGSWTENVLYAFTGGADGGQPNEGVVRDARGNLYGTTNVGGIAGAPMKRQ